MPLPNIAGVALGAVNYQDATIRERRTDGFDVKLNYQLSPKDQVSIRYSFQRPTVFEPGNFADSVFGGPYQGGFVGTGVNKTQSAAGNWTRTLTNTFVMDARFGVSTYHNEALSAGTGLNTAAEVGIPGANLDTYTSGMTPINLQGYSNPVVGFSASLPWNRGETHRTLAATGHDQAVGQPHDQVRRRLPPQQRLPAADAGSGRAARLLHLQRRPDRRRRTSPRPQNNVGNSLAAFLLDRPSTAGRDLAVIDKPGTRLLGDVLVHPRQVAGVAEDDDRPRPAARVLHAVRRHPDAGRPVELRSGDQHSCWCPATATCPTTSASSPRGATSTRDRPVLADRRQDRWCAPATASSTIPFGDNTYAFNFPVKQNNQFTAANAFIPPAGDHDGGRLPGAGRGADPVQRAASTSAPTRGSATPATSSSRPI